MVWKLLEGWGEQVTGKVERSWVKSINIVKEKTTGPKDKALVLKPMTRNLGLTPDPNAKFQPSPGM